MPSRSSGGWLATAAAAALVLAGVIVLIAVDRSDEPVGRRSPTASAADSRRPAATSTTSASLSPDPILIAAGDIADCGVTADEDTAALLDELPGTVAALGDLAYPSGTPDEFANCYTPNWGRHAARTRPVPGNHDYETQGAAGYFGYFGAAAGDLTQGWYAYDVGPWHVVALNSICAAVGGCGAGAPQEQWLRADLAEHSVRCTLAYWHHPRFSSAQHGSDPAYDAFWHALYEAGADVVIVGHDHVYERFAPQTPAAARDDAAGIRQFTVGTGGRSHYEFGSPIANSELRDNTSFGVLALTLHAASYEWQFFPAAGDTFTDTGSDDCS
ncbi:MAG: metallophosphoesterase [Candidatus Limnocylindria bacterium]